MIMQRFVRILPICVCALACNSATAPVTVLPVEFTVVVGPVSPPTAAIDGAGDQVVATIVRPAVCGYENGASATLDHGSLTVTVSLISHGPFACDPVNGSFTYRVVVDGAPSGTYDAALQFHLQLESVLASDFYLIPFDSTVARNRVSIP
jgi:hypothetical protein